jgi:hypothetical protein
MAANEKAERTFRLDLNFAELEAVAWAVWFSMPAARQDDVAPLRSVDGKIFDRRRRFRTAGPAQDEPARVEPGASS